MANPQVTLNNTVVALTLAAGTGAGTSLAFNPSGNNFNVWLNGTKVIPDTLLNALQITVNGFTVSAGTNAPPWTSISIAIAASSTLVGATGYIINANAQNSSSTAATTTATFDIVGQGGGGGGGGTAPTVAPVLTATSAAGSNTIGYTAPGAGNSVAISRGTVSGGPYTLLSTVATAAAGSYNDNSAVVGTPYFYTAVFKNTVGNGPVSNQVTATATQAASAGTSTGTSNVVAVTPNAATANPTNLVGYSQNTAALLVWTNPAQLSSISVMQRTQVAAGTALNPWVSVVTLPAATAGNPATVPNTYTVISLNNGVVYEFEVISNP